MRVTHFETVFGIVCVDADGDGEVFPPFVAFFEDMDPKKHSNSPYGWKNYGWTIREAVNGLLLDRANLIGEMFASYGQVQH